MLVLISLLSFIFSYSFEPFNVNETEHKINSIWILLIHACTPFPIAFTYIRVLNRNCKNESTWTLGKEAFHLSVILLIIGVTSFLIRDLIYTNPDNWSFRYFWEEIQNTFLIGFLLVLIVLPLNLERLIHIHQSRLRKLPVNSPESALNNSFITVINLVSNERFELKMADFIFAKVESNYTEIFTASSNGINKTLIRITLKELEEQLAPVSESVFKTHRSYLVHLNKIESISGNAQGYQLVLKNCSITIPVSRSNIANFNIAYSKYR